jgi:hypothetical protein
MKTPRRITAHHDERRRRQERIGPCPEQDVRAIIGSKLAISDDEIVTLVGRAVAQSREIGNDLDSLEAQPFEYAPHAERKDLIIGDYD